MDSFKFKPIIGLELHVELKTKSKMFCGCSAKHFQVKPNTHTCPVCLGLPGALPVPNKKAIEWCQMIGLAFGCKLKRQSKFDRKNYFYPDLPKGYQISQYDEPFAKNGELNIKNQKSKIKNQKYKSKIIKINRVHLEEDTGKMKHTTLKGKKVSLVDFNRSGVPLVEIVSEPDINSSEEAVLYLKKLQQIIRYLGVSDCDMEKGSMRCEANISLSKPPATSHQSPAATSNQQPATSNQQEKTGDWGSARLEAAASAANRARLGTGDLPDYKVEVKNINSFKFVKKAIEHEIERQKKLLEKGITPKQETRGFDEKKGKTYSQRTKEEAHDYRYFPEPDIPPMKFSNSKILKLSNSLPELPDERRERFIKKYRISEYYAEILARDRKVASYFEEVISQLPATSPQLPARAIASAIVNKRVDIDRVTPKQLIKKLASQVQSQVVDEKEIEKVVKKILKQNPKAVGDYKKGKKEVIGFLIGQVMKAMAGKADPQLAKTILKKLLH